MSLPKVIELKKCPCCDEDQLEQIRSMQKMCDEYAERIFDRQNKTGNYADESTRARWQGQSDILRWAIELLEGRGGCL